MGSPFTSSLNSISFHFHTHPSFLRPVDAPKFGSVFLMPSPQEKLGHFKESSISFSTRNFRIRSRSGKTRFSSPRNSNSSPHASNGDSDPPAKAKLLVVSSIIIVSLAVANRVLYKLALVPLKQYPFFLAQLTTFGYVIVYFSILYLRHRANIVTDEMISLPKSRLLAVGLLEALGIATGMTAAASLPGPAIPILSQTFLVWQLIFSAILLGRRYSSNEIAGCVTITAGVLVAVGSGSTSNAGQMLSGVAPLWSALMVASSACQAGASIMKEFIFIDAGNRLHGKSLDIFVVNSFGSGFQALFVLLLLPFLSNLKGISLAQLPSYLMHGAACFLNIGAERPDCKGAPLLPLLYVITNLAFNITLLSLVKKFSAVVASLLVMLSVPISIYILSLPLPYLPEGASLSPLFLTGSLLLVLGLVFYYIPQRSK
ncbi:protein CLT2, chloroplastic-like [Momordica charantia]|uniref:Protein CLT2, chloroplastic-like n=1 Tax=Momordica charantia TaxID=3673 RepID=A0A6J1BR98_MOMCH|nr:protein CLT2, chloroplastic-like [Momordica charantia]